MNSPGVLLAQLKIKPSVVTFGSVAPLTAIVPKVQSSLVQLRHGPNKYERKISCISVAELGPKSEIDTEMTLTR